MCGGGVRGAGGKNLFEVFCCVLLWRCGIFFEGEMVHKEHIF